MEEAKTNLSRVRINATQDAKGFFKLEATAEFETVDQAAQALADAITKARLTMTAAGLKVLATPSE